MDSTASAAARSDTLALLCQNILTSIVRIQSGKQPLADLETFRRRMKTAIQEFEREAGVAGYGAGESREAAFAVVAFLDETILSSRDPRADEWRKRPLNNELFGQAITGNVFFDKLTDLERGRDSTQLAEHPGGICSLPAAGLRRTLCTPVAGRGVSDRG